MICRTLPHLVLEGPAQMALDHALLDAVDADPRSGYFRTYEWARPTLSLGCLQRWSEADERWRDVAVVRRPTGGGAIWHHHDLTYALILPRSRPDSDRAERLYATVHGAIRQALCDAGIASERCGVTDVRKVRDRPFLCFTDHHAEDIVISGLKVVGSAQRRRPSAVLQHGSLLLARSATTPELPGLRETASPPTATLRDLLRRRVVEALELTPREEGIPPVLLDAAGRLTADVYSDRDWTFGR